MICIVLNLLMFSIHKFSLHLHHFSLSTIYSQIQIFCDSIYCEEVPPNPTLPLIFAFTSASFLYDSELILLDVQQKETEKQCN